MFMTQFTLIEVMTKDKLIHQGILHRPKKPTKKAILWVHGLTGRFYGDPLLMNLFGELCDKHDVAFASINNRGHDIITNLKKVDAAHLGGFRRVVGGSGVEIFEECVLDIDAGISYLVGLGYTEVYLAGHSTGANKVCYYAATKSDARVAGVVLAGPMSDRLMQEKDKLNYEKNLLAAKAQVLAGRGDRIQQSESFFPVTSRRALSLLTPNSPEDVFTYGDTDKPLRVFAKITKPMLVIFSGADESADRPVEAIRAVFDKTTRSKHYVSRIIADATHSYTGKEKDFVTMVVKWAASL